ncbi:hypothetical protein L198_07059 [Cryptococcus wingfieldii CBS 7118]|uniref:Uncharacterized protein n=1 Tax=Cryptococcus wingfieldii CBS 7118 TaxID=1295528 RepID=A0A1E3IFP0_9TREE|nr:hypothetical protein L198_07059 [Cryptococcus wingfieldii CBS 7118]ODN87432.1 hypothetical protein L198_07059 [Cryptococcus wingfieldii CBS 7118]
MELGSTASFQQKAPLGPTPTSASATSSEALIKVLEEKIKKLSLKAAPQTEVIYTSVIRAREPEPFSGNPDKLEWFIFHTQLYFEADSDTFDSDQRKIIFTQPRPAFLLDYDLLIAQLRRKWGVPNVRGRGQRNRRGYRQTDVAYNI